MAPQPASNQKHKSTGPRTESGKAASSKNALRHGLASGTILIPGEDPAEFQALEDALFDQYQPADPTQTILVHDMAKHHWLKDRALRLQGEALSLASPGEIPATFPVLLRYQTTNDRAFYKALDTLKVLQLQAENDAYDFVSQQQKDIAEHRLKSYNFQSPNHPSVSPFGPKIEKDAPTNAAHVRILS
jgi:hypothetical protein